MKICVYCLCRCGKRYALPRICPKCKNIRANPNYDQIMQNFEFERTINETIIYQKRIGTEERYGQEGDYLMKIKFDK